MDSHRHKPIDAAGRPAPLIAARVLVVHDDGRVDVRNEVSRAMRAKVPVPRGYTATVGDRVVVGQLYGDPNRPVVLAVL